MEKTFLDFFAGIGGFRRGMEMAGYKCLGHCEWDKYANSSYNKIHEPKEVEWFGEDIRRVRASELPKSDVWCFGFPCQDISVAGKQLGFNGKRSSLFFTVTRLVADLEEKDRPSILFIENVKNLLSVNGGVDFLKLLIELDEIGYDAEWQVINSKHFGVPQNRERVFIIGHIRGRSRRKVFPIERTDREVGLPIKRIAHSKYFRRVYQTFDITGSTEALDTCQGGGRQPCVMIRAVLTPDRINKRQNGRRFKDPGEPMFTLTAQDRHGVQIEDRIRKLTPKECFRLQGWKDEDYEKAASVCSNSQLYKQAGNGVTVNVIYEIAKRF